MSDGRRGEFCKHAVAAGLAWLAGKAHVERLVARANNHAYVEAAELADTIRKLMSQVGGEAAFPGWITELKVKHRAKRNFLKRLDSL